ncbi:hypothetical protein [Methylobacter sp. sgz302048]|uniref:hypothetical protein n=1 Tax=Methylobacter sp. sgz302048 TaxID=3455945 RepID=UPI003FA0D702
MKKFTRTKIILGIAALAFNINAAQADSINAEPKKGILPDNFKSMMLFMANGSIPLSEAGPEPEEVAWDFQYNIMHRTDAEVEEVRQKALAFFKEQFGIDAENDPGIWFHPYRVERASHYRAYVISGEKIPSSGWEVRDGGWEARVIDPNGKVLGGHLAGHFVPPGTFFVDGNYNILTDQCEKNHGKHCEKKREITMSYRSKEPMIPAGPNIPGIITFPIMCELGSETFGIGVSGGFSQPTLTDEGQTLQYNVRNVLTFSDKNGN